MEKATNIKLMFGFKMKLGLGNKVLLLGYGQKKVLDLEQFVSSAFVICHPALSTITKACLSFAVA
jgi:hypothetical protein